MQTDIYITINKQKLYKEYINKLSQDMESSNTTGKLLKEDIWTLGMLSKLGFPSTSTFAVHHFRLDNPKMMIEFKFFILYKLVERNWSVNTVTWTYKKDLYIWECFLNNQFPKAESVLDIDEQFLINAWHEHLESMYPERVSNESVTLSGELKSYRTAIYNFPENMVRTLKEWLPKESNNEWDGDIWNVVVLSKYGIRYVKSSDHTTINFGCTKDPSFRALFKRYTKENLLGGVNYTWGTAGIYYYKINSFADFYLELHPDRHDFKELCVEDMQKYYEYISSKPGIKNVSRNLNYTVKILKSFFKYIQIEEYPEAPKIMIEKIIRLQDFPTRGWASEFNVEKCVPEYVVCQLLKYADKLPLDSNLIVLIMLNTGLRISDTLELTFEALQYHEENYWLELPIIKSKIKSVQIPISNELAQIIQDRIDRLKQYGEEKTNPHHYLFVSDRKSNGLPISQKKVLLNLNRLAYKANICDKDGNLYHFRNQAFRHTFAINCLNNGMDIITLQDFLGHASPEVTLVYARLLDTTKKKIFKEVMKSGIFSFKEDTVVENVELSEIDPKKIERFWLTFKVNAIDTPYGICLQRSEGKCSFAMQPPCLTCKGGEPCKDLCIGATSLDAEKYDILIKSAQNMISLANANNKPEMEEENRNLLNRYLVIKEKLNAGAIIYGRPERIACLSEGGSSHEQAGNDK